jgi:hypothetical protein
VRTTCTIITIAFFLHLAWLKCFYLISTRHATS